MQRIINRPGGVVEDMLQGFVLAHRKIVATTANPRVVKYREAPVAGKVGLVSGGGSGHKPAFVGYVGRGLLDAVAVGEIFSSPTAKNFFDAFRVAESGRGVACLYGNYSGDNMNVKLALAMAEAEGISVKTVVANDDVASAPPEQRHRRRGVAGEVLMWKVAGAKAAQGGDLDAVIQVAQKAIDQTRSVGIGLTSCTIPAVGHANFTIEPGTMEVGIGHHGEPGISVTPLKTAHEMAGEMVDLLVPDLPFQGGDEVVVLISGLGATPVMELYIFHAEVENLLAQRGLVVHRSYVGNYFTSLEMAGVTLTLMKVDDELKALIDAECEAMGLTQFGSGT